MSETSEPEHEPAPERRYLNGISEIRAFFRTNTTAVYFFGPTAFNLLGIDLWVRNFSYVSYYDSWDGGHPRMFSPKNKPYVEFKSGEDVNNYLLRDPEVQDYLKSRGANPKVAMVFFNEETEEICRELGYELILPSNELREHLDSKIVTTKLGNEAGVPSVPNVLVEGVDSWAEVSQIAQENELGSDLVLQTPYGDSGKTTFFLTSEADWDEHAGDIIGQQVKIMRRINNTAVAVEAVLTRAGTVVGPFMTDLTGYPQLTPYKGGWCGNDVYPEVLSEQHRAAAVAMVTRLGERLRSEGYVGYFEVDILVDLDTGDVYLGELNPRISGVTSMTNVTEGAYADMPLFLFHLLEYMDVDYSLDVNEINERWRKLAANDVWSQLIMKDPGHSIERLLATPESGTYHLGDDGSLEFVRVSYDWHQIREEDECFFMRVYGPGDYRFPGADLGILVTKGRMQSADGLTDRCVQYINGIRKKYVSEPVADHKNLVPITMVK